MARRWIVYGAGAVGGVTGALLCESGADVVLVARGPHADELRRSGLRMDTPERSVTVAPAVAASPAEIGIAPGDVVLLAVKSQDTAEALHALRSSAPPETPVVCLQNGVENERAALRLFHNVYAVCVVLPAGHLVPGVVEAHSAPTPGILDLGRYPTGVDDTAESISAALRAATFESQVRPDIARWKYAKLLMNLSNAVEAVCGPEARAGRVAKLARDEGIACLRAAGIDFASEEEDAARRRGVLQLRPVGERPRGGGSSWQSLQRRSGSIESDYLNGEIVLLGRVHGVATPVNGLLQRLGTELAAARREPGSISEDELLDRLALEGATG